MNTFMSQPIPDNMIAFGVYDYSVHSQTYESVDMYREYLAKKSGTSMSSGIFKVNAKLYL